LQWPQFFPIGERLRDFSLLSSTISQPLNTEEGWFSGNRLKYYLGWYQFGSLFNSSFNVSVANIYHSLVAFSLSIYFTIIFIISNKYIKFSTYGSFFSAIIITYGSNISGILNWFPNIFYSGVDTNWWGPSRIVAGAINEFPIWSFLLGDAHPHYLNLGIVPLFLLITLNIYNYGFESKFEYITLTSLMLVSLLWLRGANPWEIPMWGGTLLLISFIFYLREKKAGIKINHENLLYGIIIVTTVVLSLIIVLIQAPLPEVDAKFELVRNPVLRTTIYEIFLHFGFPLTLIILGQIIYFLRNDEKILAITSLFFIVISFFIQEALPLIIILLFLTFFRTAKKLMNKDYQTAIFFDIYGLSALGLLILPEIVFLNDPYGGESERMNTIFKVYSYIWLPLHLYGFILTAEWSKYKINLILIRGMQCLTVLIFCGFFLSSISLRQGTDLEKNDVEGLTKIENTFVGSKSVISKLRKMPKGIVVEAQGDPYSWSNHIATLSYQPSYLGWSNHITLLNKEYDEVARRKNLIETIYNSLNCTDKYDSLKKENITYLVLGPLEKNISGDFSCLKVLFKYGRYKILGLK
jgi:uncharacterized membrane protein